MADRHLIHKPTGALYIWQPVFAGNPEFEEVPQAEPELVVAIDETATETIATDPVVEQPPTIVDFPPIDIVDGETNG